jgi:MFS family permease
MTVTRRQTWFALFILFAINTMNFYDRQLLGVLAEPIRKEWHLTDSALGWLGAAFTLIYAAVGVPLGRLSDFWRRKRILSLGVAAWSILTAASGFTWSYASMFVARLGVGVGEASCAPAANSLIGDLFPAARRSIAISVFMLGLPVGIFLSGMISGDVAFAYGWRAAFWVACLPGLMLAVAAPFMTEPERGATETHAVAGRAREGSPYLRVLSIPTMWWIIASGALHNFNAYAVNGFLPAFLARFHGLNLKQANHVTAYVLGAVGVVGLIGGGLIGDIVRRKHKNGRLVIATVALFISAPCVLLALTRPKGDLVTFMALMSAGWMLMYVYYATVYSAIQDIVEPGLRGTAMALYFFAMYVLGGSFGPPVTGMLSDHFAHEAMLAAHVTAVGEAQRAAGLHSAMYVIPAVSLTLAFVLYAASRTVAKDMDALDTWMHSHEHSAAGANK